MVSASLNTYRQSPRKVRLIAGLIQKKSIEEALAILQFSPKDASDAVRKLLNSALANAKENTELLKENLYVKSMTVNQGVTLRRSMPRARGSAFPIKKRTSHITLVLDTKDNVRIKKDKNSNTKY